MQTRPMRRARAFIALHEAGARVPRRAGRARSRRRCPTAAAGRAASCSTRIALAARQHADARAAVAQRLARDRHARARGASRSATTSAVIIFVSEAIGSTRVGLVAPQHAARVDVEQQAGARRVLEARADRVARVLEPDGERRGRGPPPASGAVAGRRRAARRPGARRAGGARAARAARRRRRGRAAHSSSSDRQHGRARAAGGACGRPGTACRASALAAALRRLRERAEDPEREHRDDEERRSA